MSNQKPHPGRDLTPAAKIANPNLREHLPQRRETNSLYLPDEQFRRLETVATRAYRSGVLPKAVDGPEKAFIIALKGLALGLDPLFAMEHIVVINGKATIDGQAMLALIYQNRETKVSFPEVKDPAVECRVKMNRRGSELEVRWTIERAKKAGLLSNPSWQKYPDQMLRWRAISECARVIAPDIVGGIYLHEELNPKAVVNEAGEIIEAEFTVSSSSDVKTNNSGDAPKRPLPDTSTPEPASSNTIPAQAPDENNVVEEDRKSQELGFPNSQIHAMALKLFWTKARERKVPEDGIRKWLEAAGFQSTKELSHKTLGELTRFVEGHVTQEVVEVEDEFGSADSGYEPS